MRRPIIIIGAPRSGTTLLADLLDIHPDVALAQEPRLVWRYGNDGRSDELRPADARPEVIDHITTTFAALVRDRGRSRLAEKTPANALRPAFVDAVFPDARFVHITRDGWGAVPSMRAFWQRRAEGLDRRQLSKAGRRLREMSPSQWRYYLPEAWRRVASSRRHVPLYGPRLAGIQQVADELGHLEAAARQWRDCVTQSGTFGRSLPAERYLELRLEELDAAAVEQLLEFCDLPPASAVSEKLLADFDPAMARGQVALGDDERRLIAPYVEPTNAWIGYGAPSPNRPGDRPVSASVPG